MPLSQKEEVFIRKYVMWTGFFGGVFLRIGVDPQGEIMKALISLLPVSPLIAQLLTGLFGLILIAFTINDLNDVYSTGGSLGLLTVTVAFISGLIILSDSVIGAFLLIFDIYLAKFAIKGKNGLKS
jgi:hypothetical protein